MESLHRKIIGKSLELHLLYVVRYTVENTQPHVLRFLSDDHSASLISNPYFVQFVSRHV